MLRHGQQLGHTRHEAAALPRHQLRGARGGAGAAASEGVECPERPVDGVNLSRRAGGIHGKQLLQQRGHGRERRRRQRRVGGRGCRVDESV